VLSLDEKKGVLMNKRIFIIVLLILALPGLSGCAVIKKVFKKKQSTSYPYYVTAKKWFSYVEQKAKVWRSDVVFYGITDTVVNMDGEGGRWEYLFDSPGANKQAIVILEGGFISLKEETRVVLTSVKRWRLDSAGAMKKANQIGGKAFLENNPQAKITMSLLTELPNSREKQTIWLVKYQGLSSMFYIVIDAATGKMVWKKLINYQ
jgi:outer membrane protein assembly factor BamB